MAEKKTVFLSSAQHADEFKTEREALPVLFQREPLHARFRLIRVEDRASPDTIAAHTTRMAGQADSLILLLGSDLRDAVLAEYNEARRRGRLVFVFVRSGTVHTIRMQNFIEDILKPAHSLVVYDNFQDLCQKVENSLLGHFADTSGLRSTPPGSTPPPPSSEQGERGLRLLVGVLSTEGAALTERRFFECLVEEALLTHRSGLTSPGVCDWVARALGSRKTGLDAKVLAAIEELRGQKLIGLQSDSRLVLAPMERQHLEEAARASDEFETRILSVIYDARRSELASITAIDFHRVILRVVSGVIHETSLAVASVPFTGDRNPYSYDAEAISAYVSSALTEIDLLGCPLSAWHSTILDVLLTDNDELITWLNAMRKAYWATATAGLDPEAVGSAMELIRGFCIYLDSHLVIRTMVRAGNENDLCQEIVTQARILGVTVRISYPIFQEVERAFRSADRIVSSSNGDVERALELYRNLNFNRKTDILDGYIAARSASPHLLWNSYINRFYSPVQERKLRDYLRNELGIEVEDPQVFAEDQQEAITELTQRLLNRRSVPVEMPSGEASLEEKNRWREQFNLRESEAQQLVSLYSRRENPEPGLMNYWFATFDTFVYEVCIDIASCGKRCYQLPCFIKPARLVELLTSIAPTRLSTNVFRAILLTPIIKHVAGYLETELIAQMLAARIDLDIRNLQTLRHMFSDILNKPAVLEAMAEVESRRYGPGASQAIENAKDKMIVAFKDEAARARADADEFNRRTQIAEKKAEKETRRRRYFSGLLTAIKRERRKR